ncbi:hypothetical protein FBU30_009120 [Linnemannia zychae]|nr:hypothetical protein FBU30_009120 [Linnemannia zychae]
MILVTAPYATESDLADISDGRPHTNQATNALNELEFDHRKRQTTGSEVTHKTKNRKKAPTGDSKAVIRNIHTESRIHRYKLLDTKHF